MTAIGLYFRGMTKEEVNALRARLNDLARSMGYRAKAGPTAKAGNLAALLVAIDRGEVALIHISEETTTDDLDRYAHQISRDNIATDSWGLDILKKDVASALERAARVQNAV